MNLRLIILYIVYKLIGRMKPNYNPHHNISPHNGSHTHKYTPNHSQPRLSHTLNYTNSNKDIALKKDQFKDPKYLPTNSATYVHNHITNSQTSPPKPQINNKNIPAFLENKTPPLKGSMYVGQSKFQSINKLPKEKSQINNPYLNDKQKRTPRMTQTNFAQMRSSNIESTVQTNKIPTFINEKKKIQQPAKKVPYPKEAQRPQSSKQLINKFEIATEASLTSSYGMMKDSKMELDPTAEWVKKSWSKKKTKKIAINDFQQIKELGTGKYGKVFLVNQKKNNFMCALKIVQKKLLKQEQITEQFIRELKIQTYLSHPNIIKMYGFFDDIVNIYIILEVGTGGQLFKQLKKHQCMPQLKVANIMRQVCQAVNELHSNKIIHRDIKPQNIVLHDNVIKLCDFGWSVYRDETMRKTFCGTPIYVSPQILKGNQYDEKIDIWSLGVMMYEMMVGENPFKITKEEELVKIIKNSIQIPSYVEISEEGRNFLFSCLQKDPQNRLSIRQLLNHQFFKKYPQKNDKKVGM